jgi:hypothetical protein
MLNKNLELLVREAGGGEVAKVSVTKVLGNKGPSGSEPGMVMEFMSGTGNVLRTYPKTPARRNAINANEMWRRAS